MSCPIDAMHIAAKIQLLRWSCMCFDTGASMLHVFIEWYQDRGESVLFGGVPCILCRRMSHDTVSFLRCQRLDQAPFAATHVSNLDTKIAACSDAWCREQKRWNA